MEAFLSGVELKAGDQVFAATARALGSKLDACAESDSAAAAQAVPRLSSQFVDVLGRLQQAVPREPDAIDRIAQRREARMLAAAMRNGSADSAHNDGRHAP